MYDLVGLRIHPDPRRAAEQVRVGAAAGLLVLAKRHQVLAVARELHHAVAVVAADPDEVVVVDEDAVRLAGPVGEVGHRALAPALHQLALLVELQHRRRRLAAGAHLHRLWFGRVEARHLPRFLVELFLGQRLGQMRDPHVLFGVDEDAGDRAHDPVIGHVLRPGRVDLERRSGRGLTVDARLEREQRDAAQQERGADMRQSEIRHDERV